MSSTITRRDADRNLEGQTIEYWSKREPYLSSRSVFGRIECLTAIRSRNETTFVARGWAFDSKGPISRLDITSQGESSATTVYGLERLDVQAKFPRQPLSLVSGFVSRFSLPDQGTLYDTILLRGSYMRGDEQVHFVFEPQPVSYGIRQPGEYISRTICDSLPQKPYLVIVIPESTPLDYEPITPLAEYALLHGLELVVFSDRSVAELEDVSTAHPWKRRVSHTCELLARSLWGSSQYIHSIVVLGDLSRKLLCEQLAPIMATAPVPHIVWIPSDELRSEIPLELRGFGTQILVEPKHSPSQLLHVLNRVNLTARLCAS